MANNSDIKIYISRKQRGRLCSSGPVIKAVLDAEGLGGLAPDHLDSGAPVLVKEDGGLSEYCVSVSDTKSYILVCLREGPVGIDAEEGSRRVRASAAKALHPLEKRCLEGLEPESSEWRGEFLRIWTAKESYMKLCGEGLRMGLSSFSVVGEDLGYLSEVKREGFPEADLYFAEGPSGLIVSACVPAGSGALSIDLSRIECAFPPKSTTLEKAAGLLDARDYSEAGLKKRLRASGYSEGEAEEAGSLLKERGYIDDEAFALRLAERLYASGRGRLAVIRGLEEKGVGREPAAEAADKASELFPSEEARALAAAYKACGIKDAEDPEPADEKKLAKAARKLSSLGYESSVIWSVLEKLQR